MKTLLRLAAIFIILTPFALALTLPVFRGATNPSPVNPEEHQGPNHPVTLTEFGDFQCPHCAAFAVYAVPALKEDFFDSGRVEFEYRHFPILGSQSTAAAEASECARDQGRFQDYHDVLFDIALSPQNEIELRPTNLIELSRLMGMDHQTFSTCVMDRTHEDTVQKDADIARSLGARGTPALFLDGRPLPWTDYDNLKERITDYLDLHSRQHD